MDHIYKGVLFSESIPRGAKIGVEVDAKLDDSWSWNGGSQLRCLDDVKDILAKKVQAAGCNALVEFTYGQRSVSFWRSLMSVDDVIWWGKGKSAKVNL